MNTNTGKEVSLKSSAMANNMQELDCDTRESKVKYMICLNILKALKEKRLSGFESCVVKIKKGDCPALKMRKEEIEKGEPIYFQPREEVAKKVHVENKETDPELKETDAYKRGANLVSNTAKSKTKKKKEIVQDAKQEAEQHEAQHEAREAKPESNASSIAKMLISQQKRNK
jgi:hypothetical protein